MAWSENPSARPLSSIKWELRPGDSWEFDLIKILIKKKKIAKNKGTWKLSPSPVAHGCMSP